MENKGFNYTVSVEIEISFDEVEYLIKLARTHYDYACKRLAVDGLLQRWQSRIRGRRECNVENPDVINETISFRDCDLFTKLCESEVYVRPVEDNKNLYFVFHGLCGAMNDEVKTILRTVQLKPYQREEIVRLSSTEKTKTITIPSRLGKS